MSLYNNFNCFKSLKFSSIGIKKISLLKLLCCIHLLIFKQFNIDEFIFKYFIISYERKNFSLRNFI